MDIVAINVLWHLKLRLRLQELTELRAQVGGQLDEHAQNGSCHVVM